jgi:hypothetical protein
MAKILRKAELAPAVYEFVVAGTAGHPQMSAGTVRHRPC